MQITFNGLSSFRLQTKEAVVVIDPFDKSFGPNPPRGSADILVLSDSESSEYSQISGFSGEPFVIENPGEYDVKGVTVTGIPLKKEEGYINVYLIESEDIKILFLGHIKEFNIKQDDLESLGEIHILVLPVGGADVLSASSAVEVVREVEPRIVIPCSYKEDSFKTKFEPIDKFLKEMGGNAETLEKLTIKKKDLVNEEVKVVVLESK